MCVLGEYVHCHGMYGKAVCFVQQQLCSDLVLSDGFV